MFSKAIHMKRVCWNPHFARLLASSDDIFVEEKAFYQRERQQH
jgi:hypothetical protein